MRKFTLFFMSLFFAVGAMAQTFVMPETGKYYKIKGDNSQYPWLMGVQKSGGSGVAVSANESDAAIFEKTANGLKVYGTNTYLYYSGSDDVTIGNTESNVVIGDYNNSTDNGTKYSIKVAGAYMYNNNTDQQVHTSGTFITNIERYWGFIEVNMGGNGEDDGKVVADGVYLIKNNYNNRGAMAYGTWNNAEYFGLTEITLNGCTGNNLSVDPVSNKYWYVKTTEKGIYFYNIGKGYFLQEHAQEKVTCAEAIANGFVMVERAANNTNYVSVKSGNYYLSYSCGWAPNSAGGSVRWLTSDEAAATLMTFTAVDATAYATQIANADALIAAFESDNNEAKAALAEAIAQAEASLATITIGERVGEYSCGGYTHAEIESYLGSARNFYNSIDANTSVESIEAYIEFINGTMELCALNMPKNGEYFRVAYDYGGTVGKLYLQGLDSEQEKNNQISFPAKFAAECGAESIWYYYDGALYSYTAGRCLNETGNNRGLYNVGEKVNATFSASTRAAGKYNIVCSSYVHANVTGTNYYTDHCSANNCAQHDLILEAVTELPVSISAAGYATFFAPVAVTVPADVKAYTVSINGEWATLNEIEGDVIPANTGVVLEGAQNTYDFVITTTEATATSDLRGSAATTYYTEAGTYYALGIVDGVVAFYKDAFNNSRFQNNSHKAYLYVAGTNNTASYSFRYGEGTTGIDEMTEQRAESKEIYDITGRRVENVTAPGIYIVNGKKVLVK